MADRTTRKRPGAWNAAAGRSPNPEENPTSATSAPRPSVDAKAKPRKFTALLDADTDARFGQLLADVRGQVGAVATRTDGHGRTRAGYDPSRADLLRALLVVAENDPAVRVAVYDQIRSHYGTTA